MKLNVCEGKAAERKLEREEEEERCVTVSVYPNEKLMASTHGRLSAMEDFKRTMICCYCTTEAMMGHGNDLKHDSDPNLKGIFR
ncbi:unnamed protein product [Heligmosomoides polygyrus]|uniref:Uncharacterized protein n=1 Tax=Heligmosomoides polygyrus TaxID=6339 RepID=A0A183G2I4_HELPZ|nr:unnamed protein product [Heligmosomoides polygyrus]